MKHDKLLDAIGQVYDSLIAEAEHTRSLPQPKKAAIHWRRWAATAVALVLVIGLGYGAVSLGSIHFGGYGSGGSVSNSSENATAPSESAALDSQKPNPAYEGTAPEVEAGILEPPGGSAAGDTEAAENPAAESSEGAPAAGEEGTVLTSPPTLYVADTAILPGSYEWTIPDGDEKQTTIACGSSPLDKKETITRISLPDSDTVHLDIIEDGLTQITAYCYPGDSWGNDQTEPTELTVDGTTITLPDSSLDWIVVVNITWEAEGYSGNAEYDFLIQRKGS